jgi:predicted metal-dependent peptidase
MPRMKLYMDRGFGPDLAPFSVKHYNKAADYVINDLLHHCGLGEMPEGGLYRPDVSYQDLVDEVYCRIDKDDDDNNNGSGGHGGFDQHLPPQDPSNQPSDADVKRSIASARNAAKAMGKLPGALERLIGEVLEPTQDWKEVLRNHITARAGRDTATWTKPNRRRLALAPHIYMPGVTGFQIGGVAIINDTSGSVSEKETNQFMGEVSSILAECHPEWCKILWVDSQVAGVDDVDDPEEIPHLTPKGGGGTDMGAGFKYMDEHGIRPNMCIVLTDGYTPWGEAPDYEVIWGITAKDIEAPFGKTVHVKVE